MKKILILLFVAAVYFACNSGTEQNKDKTTDSNAAEIKKDSLILERGMQISGQAQGKLAGKLMQSIQDSGVAYALQFCSVEALPLTQSVGEEQGVKVSRVSHKPRNPLNRANEAEMNIIKNYQNLVAQNAEPKPQVVEKDNHFMYYGPIVIPADLCLKCHGEPGKDIAEEDFITIQMLYPEDQATGFALGDLRGMWKIRFDKAAL
ncbi:MAG: DUF3365 domain-containing protein [Chitinophagales bacterium]